MIDPKELRLWNLVDCKYLRSAPDEWVGDLFYVVSIGTDGINGWRYGKDPLKWFVLDSKSLMGFKSENISPIPITPEWIERLGFELRLKHDGDDFIYWNYNGFEIWQHGEGFCHDFHFGGDIKYVHQLQNLYFALTGQELNPKDNA